MPRLSKSRFQTGIQCQRALWMDTYERDLRDQVGESQQHVFDTGTAVGELARRRFPGGVLVEEDHTQSAQALQTTARLLENPPRALYEAALEHGGVFVRADILVHVEDDVWDLYEVKSGTKVKPENITDVAVQAWAIEGAGLRLRRLHLMHLDRSYIFPGGEYDLDSLFSAEDITAEARAFMPQVPGIVSDLLEMLSGPKPDMRIGKRCSTPYTCAYRGACHEFLPKANAVTDLPRITDDLLHALLRDGIHSIADVPADYPGLTSQQRSVIELVRSGEPRIEGNPRAALQQLTYPIHFLDFETLMSALPLYPGTRPWQAVPFQWSDHVLHSDGRLEHREFLHEDQGDPRPAFLDSLLEALGETGSIVVYSPYEATQLGYLASAYPVRAGDIDAVRSRLFDLLVTVRTHVRHPATLGSSSIKVVLPALVKDLSYDDLGIAEGSTASLRYLQCATGVIPPEQRTQVYDDLRAYCGVDTKAMVRIYEELLQA